MEKKKPKLPFSKVIPWQKIRIELLLLVLASIILAAVPLTYVKFLQPAINDLNLLARSIASYNLPLISKTHLTTLIQACWQIASIYATMALIHPVVAVLVAKANRGLTIKLFEYALDHYYKIPLDVLRNKRTSGLVDQINAYSESICDIVNFIFMYFISDGFQVMIIIYDAFNSSIRLGATLLVGIMIMFSLSILLAYRTAKKNNLLFQRKNKNTAMMIDTLKYPLLEKLMSLQQYSYDKLTLKNESLAQAQHDCLVFNGFSKFVFSITGTLLCILFCIKSAEAGTIGLESNIRNAFILFNNLWKLFSTTVPFLGTLGKLTRALELFKLSLRSQVHPKGLINKQSILSKMEVDRVDKIEVKHLYYYQDNKTIFKDVSFTITQGLNIIEGQSGSGKSTLIGLLLGVNRAPEQSIFLNDIPIEFINHSTLPKCFSVMLQEDPIFDESIIENITLGDSDRSGIQLENALVKSQVAQFIGKDRSGYQKMCGQDGRALSGGQAKRICLARFIYYDRESKVCILDEPLTHLHEALIVEIVNFILGLKQEGRIVIVIDHTGRLKDYADQIIKLDNIYTTPPKIDISTEPTEISDLS